jgi:hypothetical protein
MAILGLHAITGCDTVSAFSGKGKIKPVKVMLSDDSFVDWLYSFGNEWELEENMLEEMERFVCAIYIKGVCKDVNKLRYQIFQARAGKIDGKNMLPPCKDSLDLHLKRANYQVNVWRKCLQQFPEQPSPDGHGWKLEAENILIKWNTIPQAPVGLLDMLSCKFKRKCSPNTCACIINGLRCTDVTMLS